MPRFDEVADQVAATDVPVLFVDTCILLDIIRSTNRCLCNYADRASELLRLSSQSPPGCLIVASSIVRDEWIANVQQVTDETVRHLAKIEEQSEHFHDACRALGITAPFAPAKYSQLGLAERLRGLGQQLLDNAIHNDPNQEIQSRAFARVVQNRPPSHRGGQVQDCGIIEEYLAVCGRLRQIGYAQPRVFCTSNTEDYCEAGATPHPALALEFAAISLKFTANLPWAVHEITH